MKTFIISVAFIFIAVIPTTAQDYFFGLSYDMAAPLGETSDYVSKYSWRGVSFEGRSFLQSNLSVGFFFGWNVFSDKITGDFTNDTRTYSGTQLRFINAFPLLLEGHYYLGEDFNTRPYLGLGLGTNRTRQRTEMGLFAVDNNNWQFELCPSVGVLIPTGSYSTAVHLSLRYHYAFKAGDSLDNSYLGINVGLAWWD